MLEEFAGPRLSTSSLFENLSGFRRYPHAVTRYEGDEDVLAVADLATRYREAAYRSADTSNPRVQNKWADKVHALFTDALGRDKLVDVGYR